MGYLRVLNPNVGINLKLKLIAYKYDTIWFLTYYTSYFLFLNFNF